MRCLRLHLFDRLIILIGLLSLLPSVLNAVYWREITPEEFALKEPVVDPEYGAEILFSDWELEQKYIEGSTTGSINVYMRIKVYNDKGIEQLAKQELTYSKGKNIYRIKGRTVKPDGTVIDLEKSNIFDQEVVKKGHTNLRSKKFAFPGLEAGDIVELQYKQRTGENTWYIQLEMLDWLPAQKVSRRIKPMILEGIGHNITAYQYTNPNLELDKNGYYSFELTNLQAKPTEPHSFPDMHLGPVVFLYYYERMIEPNRRSYWKDLAKQQFQEGKKDFKPSKEITEFALNYTKHAKTDTGKLKLLYQYCQNKLTNHHYSHGVYTSKELENLPENFNANQTFKRGHGTPEDINGLFGAFAKALGLDPRYAQAPDNRFINFQESMTNAFSLSQDSVAVEIDGKLQFYNPGNPFLPADSIEWWSYGSKVLVATPKGPPLLDMPMPPSDYSARKRTGDFTIDAFGNLSGKVSKTYSGFADLDMKEELSHLLSIEEREDFLTKSLKEAQPRAKIDNIKILNRGSSIVPLQVTYDLEIPEYADVAGKRIFIQLAVFEKSAPPVFTEEKRTGHIQFSYPWSEEDYIKIGIPDGYSIEEGSAPAPVKMSGLGEYTVKVSLAKKSHKLIYKRNLNINLRTLSVDAYPIVKRVFDDINNRDQHTLTFKKDSSHQQANASGK